MLAGVPVPADAVDRLEDPPEGLAELRAVLLNEHQWRQREGLDS